MIIIIAVILAGNDYHVLGNIPGTLHALAHLSFTTILWSKYSYHHYIDFLKKEREAPSNK